MLKMFLAFVRGGAAIAEERFADRNALLNRIEDARTERLLMDAGKPAL